MSRVALEGAPEVEVVMRRSRRARRISLRVSALDGRVTLTRPHGVSEATALAFAEEKAAWIRRARAAQGESVAVVPGATLPVEGRMVALAAAPLRRPVLEGGVLSVPGAAPGRTAAAFLKELARARLTAASDRHAARLGRPYARITLRDTRSRWGSCSDAGALMYSWRLAMAPPEVLDYVAAHEVAHLERMDHSPAYWEVVAGLCPGWREPRRWLRAHGAGLHRYRFGD